MYFASSASGNAGLRTTSAAIARIASAFSLRPPIAIAVSPDDGDALAEKAPPSVASCSAIWRLVRFVVPSRSNEAVTIARPR